jgi:hypothetical protein
MGGGDNGSLGGRASSPTLPPYPSCWRPLAWRCRTSMWGIIRGAQEWRVDGVRDDPWEFFSCLHYNKSWRFLFWYICRTKFNDALPTANAFCHEMSGYHYYANKLVKIDKEAVVDWLIGCREQNLGVSNTSSNYEYIINIDMWLDRVADCPRRLLTDVRC